MFYRWLRTRQPQPGAPALAFDMSMSLPVFTIPGRGIGVAYDFRPTQPTQQYYNHVSPYAGIPTIAGQIFGQPLLNPNG
jgi:hypothetical protein